MGKLAKLIIIATAFSGSALWWISRVGEGVSDEALTAIQGDVERGETIFYVAGCVTCHALPESEHLPSEGEKAVLGGGRHFVTIFGTFIAPNISPHPDRGIGAWSIAQFASAMLRGVSPDGRHYYPAFPYPSYTRMSLQDIVDLKTYLDTLPNHARDNEPHQIVFPYSIREALGLWKWLYLDDTPVVAIENQDPELLRGRYLVEGPGHCAECHTPRNILGGFDNARWLAGAANPDGDGSSPNITPHSTGIAHWEVADIAEYLFSGFTPEYDVVGSSMAEVVDNTAHLSDEDRVAIARYLQFVPEVED